MRLGRLEVTRGALKATLLGCALVGFICASLLVYHELKSSALQARYFSQLARGAGYAVAPGASPDARFPRSGPYDDRFGHKHIPTFLKRLEHHGFAIVEQARLSPAMLAIADRGLFLPYREKNQTGLTLLDRGERVMARTQFPQRVYRNFEDIPPIVVASLLFIENRELLDDQFPRRNPAVEWDRMARAVLDQLVHAIDRDHDAPGGSTLATQIEKYRHSPGGRTVSAQDKLRQMVSASLRAYAGGEDTTAVRRRIVVDYLNTMPLAARAGYGEVEGIGDGLAILYGWEFGAVSAWLRAAAVDGVAAPTARAYKEALSLLIAQRRPTSFLQEDRLDALQSLTDSYLRLLAGTGVISSQLRDAALPIRLAPARNTMANVTQPVEKSTSAIRAELAGLLGVPRLYDLDRLDLTAAATVDASAQEAVSRALRELTDPTTAAAAQLRGPQLLERGDPAKVVLSFTLYERGEHANLVRVQADNLDQPLDINGGTKLDLGSTAKLRTLITYLDIVFKLHERYASLEPEAARRVAIDPRDPLSRWALEYLRSARDRRLDLMLEAALERSYSASPAETFYTGGAPHQFVNFRPEDNGRAMTVRVALRESVNLVFIRLMRDIVRYYTYGAPGATGSVLDLADDPRRADYLARFADREGRVFLRRFYAKYRGKSPAEAEQLLMQSVRATPRQRAAILRTLQPAATFEEFADQMRFAALPSLPAHELARLYDELSPLRMSLPDRGFAAGIHPLELWVATHLRAYPHAAEAELVEVSHAVRQAVYQWLFATRRKDAQDIRIRDLLEVEAFVNIHRHWKRLGYPFDSFVPSYAAALGAAADRPAALAELMGILLNDGVRMPATRIESLRFASETPYEVMLARAPNPGESVLDPTIARVVRKVLEEVVEQGTARRVKGALTGTDGMPVRIGGKTGTGDRRYDTYDRGGRLITSSVVERSATFAFFIGDRFFGTVTAYVPGAAAAGYAFTSALPVQVLKTLTPTIASLTGTTPLR